MCRISIEHEARNNQIVKLNQGGLGMNKEVYVVRLCHEHNLVNHVLAVIKNIDVVDKIAYKLHEEEGFEFETLAIT